MNPVANRRRIAIFLLRGIWRFQVSLIGRAITGKRKVSHQSKRQWVYKKGLTHEIRCRVYREGVVETD